MIKKLSSQIKTFQNPISSAGISESDLSNLANDTQLPEISNLNAKILYPRVSTTKAEANRVQEPRKQASTSSQAKALKTASIQLPSIDPMNSSAGGLVREPHGALGLTSPTEAVVGA